MLQVNYRNQAYKGTSYEVVPDSVSEIAGLRSTVIEHMQIENPAYTFAKKYKAGDFEDWDESELEQLAEGINYLADAWVVEGNSQVTANAMQVLTRLMDMCVKNRKELRTIYGEEEEEFAEEG